jgi:hypothetical protein
MRPPFGRIPLRSWLSLHTPRDTARIPPLSGIEGDVREPANIIWLRHGFPDTYLRSLADAGVIDLAIYDA